MVWQLVFLPNWWRGRANSVICKRVYNCPAEMMNVLNAYVMFLCSWILMLCYRLFYASLFLYLFSTAFVDFLHWGLYCICNNVRGSSYILVFNHVLESVGSSVSKSLIICLVFGSCSFRSVRHLLLRLLFFKQTYLMWLVG